VSHDVYDEAVAVARVRLAAGDDLDLVIVSFTSAQPSPTCAKPTKPSTKASSEHCRRSMKSK
jgi:hypothetical protein